MQEYLAVRKSSYDLDGLVDELNAKARDGWTVVSVVPTGGELAAILSREGAGAPAAAATTSDVAPVAAAVEPAPSYEPVPSYEPAPVSEPAGWAAAPEPAPAATPWSPTPEPQPAASEPASWGGAASQGYGSYDGGAAAAQPAASYEPQPAASYEPAPAAQPAPVVTTPAGWYPDPSGRFEMRYWDGNAWTEYVSRQGVQYTDPPTA